MTAQLGPRLPRPLAALRAATTSTRTSTLVERLREIAAARGVSVAQVAIAWVLSRGEDIVPLVGDPHAASAWTRRSAPSRSRWSDDDLAAIESAVPADAAAGDRYDEDQMAMLDSEKESGGAR